MVSESAAKYRLLIIIGVILLVYPYVIITAILFKLYQKYVQKTKYRAIAGETAVITGAARGLGKEIASELAKKGCHVAIVDINIEEAERTAAQIAERFNVKAKAYKADISKYDQVVELNEKVTNDLGPVTILINNAGIVLLSEVENPDWHEIQRMIDVNYTAHFWTIKVFLPKMEELKKGNIVGISSLMGLFAGMQHAPYTSTKFAVRGLMRSTRLGIKDKYENISLTTVFPTFLDTNKPVADIVKRSNAEMLYPMITGEDAARTIVQGMQRSEVEIYLPERTDILYRTFELLPAAWQDFILTKAFLLSQLKYDGKKGLVKNIRAFQEMKNSHVH